MSSTTRGSSSVDGSKRAGSDVGGEHGRGRQHRRVEEAQRRGVGRHGRCRRCVAAAGQGEAPITEGGDVHVVGRDRVAGGANRRDRAPERGRGGKGAARLHHHQPLGGQRPGGERVELRRIQPAQHRRVGVGKVDDDRVEAAGRAEVRVRAAQPAHRVVGHDVDARVVQRTAVGVLQGGARQLDHRGVEFHLHDLPDARLAQQFTRGQAVTAAEHQHRAGASGATEPR